MLPAVRWLSICHRRCEQCGAFFGVRLVPAMTMYPWDGKGQDPNRPLVLCREHAEDYRSHWKEMWSEYYSMIYEGIYG